MTTPTFDRTPNAHRSATAAPAASPSSTSFASAPAGEVAFAPAGASLEQAIALHLAGRLGEAESIYRAILRRTPEHADAHNLLGALCTARGDAREGLAHTRHARRLMPDEPIFLNNEALALMALDRPEDAQERLAAAARLAPDLPEPWFNLGDAHRALGEPGAAIRAYRRSLSLDPKQARAHYNLGCLLMDDGDLDGAREAFAAAAALAPEWVEAQTNLGVAHYRCGALREAETAFAAAARLDPTSTEALNNLGQVRRDRGDVLGALDALWAVVAKDTGDTQAWIAFVSAFRSARFAPGSDVAHLEDVLLACLLQDGLDAQHLAHQAVRLFRLDPGIAPLIEAAERGDAAVEEALVREAAFESLARPVVRLALERTILPDYGMERLLTAVRRLTLAAVAGGNPPPSDELLTSLARQCYHNGYVWRYDAREVALVEAIVEAMAGRALGSDPFDRTRVLVLACYVPLWSWERAEEVLEMVPETDAASADPELRSVIRQQILEPYRDRMTRRVIPRFGTIDDPVSEAVRAQYEEHPYPRWTSTNRNRPEPVAEVMKAILPDVPVPSARNMEAPRILVAGCGTGKHLVDTAYRFANADIVGVDLSVASLAYAVRRAHEEGLDGLAVVQADILALAAWSDRFDIIECGGVLHHMRDPLEGWRILTGLLRPGGLMHIGLYSELARRDVDAVRAYLAERGSDGTDDAIRAARPDIVRHLTSGSGDPAEDAGARTEQDVATREGRGDAPGSAPLLSWRDFYSMEECRDLLFHVQEHHFTLPRIASILDELGLDFLGFEGLPPQVEAAFRSAFPDPGARRSLEAWDRFEHAHPRTFSGMYQFWVRKPE